MGGWVRVGGRVDEGQDFMACKRLQATCMLRERRALSTLTAKSRQSAYNPTPMASETPVQTAMSLLNVWRVWHVWSILGGRAALHELPLQGGTCLSRLLLRKAVVDALGVVPIQYSFRSPWLSQNTHTHIANLDSS